MQKTLRIALVLEPMPLIAAAAADSLLRLGFDHVEMAAGVEAALDLIDIFEFDFALLSVLHGEGSIAPVTRQLDMAAVPYVLVSDLADGRDRPPELLEARFVTKPYCFSDIAHTLGQCPTQDCMC